MSFLSHWTTERPGIRAFSSGTNWSRPVVLMTMPPECWPRCRGSPFTRRQVSMRAAALGWEPETPAIRSCSPSSSVWGRSPPWKRLGEQVEGVVREAEHLADLAHGAFLPR